MKGLTLPVKYIVMLTIFIVVLFTGGTLYYLQLKSAIDVNYNSSLKLLAETENNKIKDWKKNWLQGLENIIADSSITDFISLQQDNIDYKILRTNIEIQLKQYFDEGNFELIEVLNRYNNVVFSAGIKQNNKTRLFASRLEIKDSKSPIDTSYFFINDSNEIVFVVEYEIGLGELNKGLIYAEVKTNQIFGSKENNILLNSNSDIDIYYIFNKKIESFRNAINPLTKKQSAKLTDIEFNASDLLNLNENGGFISFIDEVGKEQYAYMLKSDETGWIILTRNINKETYSYLLEKLSKYLLLGMLILLIVSVLIIILWFNILRFRTSAITSETLKQNIQERFDHFCHFSNDIVFLLNSTGRIVDFSEKAFKTYGYTVDEFKELNISDLRLRNDKNKTDNFFNNIKLDGLVFDTVHLKKDKTEFEVEVSMKRISYNGKIYIQNIVRNISPRKLLEKKLKESEQLFDLIVNNLNDVVYIFSVFPERKFKFLSKGIFNLTGYEQEHFIKDSSLFLKLINKDDRYKVKQMFDGDLEDKYSEIKLTNIDGNTVFVNHRSVLNKDKNNKTIARIGILRDITKQVNYSLSLKKNEESLRYLFDNNPLPMWLYDFHSKQFIDFNDAAIQHYGYTKEEFLALKVTDVLNPDEYRIYDDNEMLEIIKSKQTIESTHLLKNGKIINVELNSRLIKLTDSSDSTVLEVIQDITERKKIEDEIQESEKRFKTLAKISPVAIFRTNSRGELTYVNENWSEMSGIFAEIAFGRKWWEGLPIEDKDLVEQRWKRSIQVSNNFEGEFHLLNPKSNVKWVLAGIVKIVSDDEKVMGYVGTLTDITKMKLFEGNFRKLYYSVEQSPVSVVITNKQGDIEFVNPAVIKTTGYSKEELLGNNPRVLKSGHLNKSFYKNLWDTISAGKIWQGEFYNKRKDGTYFWEKASISPVLNERKEITNFVAVKEDITASKYLQEELIKAKNDALESSKLKTTFLSKINHELRRPLLSIMGSSHTVLTEADNSKMKEIGQVLVRESDKLNSSLKSILSLSSLETEQQNAKMEPVDISLILKKIHTLYLNAARIKGLEFEIKDIIDRIFVIGNKEMINEIISNLVDNAIKFTERGRISFFNEFSDDNYILSIQDTGIGIAENSKEIIFEPFRQADGVAHKEDGIGLGLTLARKYSEVMGGKLWFESEVNKGSTFYFRLNLVKEEDKPAEIKDVLISAANDKPVEEHKKKMLIIEDDEINLKIINAYLRKLFDISSAENSAIALEKVANEKFDIILTDIGLKDGLNGMELTKILRKMPEYASIPIIAVTAFTLAKDKEDIMKSGCSSYLSKPFTKEELTNVVNDALSVGL